MCPICLGTAALVIVKAATAGGLAAVVAPKVRRESSAQIISEQKSKEESL
jgi:hypothetical protein